MFRSTGKIVMAGALFAAAAAPAKAWAPTQNIEFIVPAGAGGGGDQLARKIVEIVESDKLLPDGVKMEVKNLSLVSGAQGYLYVKGKKSDPHTLLITLSSLFTLPIARKTEFKWDELTPLARLALDEFVLWVNADSGYKTAKDYLAAAAASKGKLRMGGTGSAQEDQIVTVMLQKAAAESKDGLDAKFTYVPLSGGGDVAKKLDGKFIDSSVNNPAEADKLWSDKKVVPLGVFDSKRMAFAGKPWDGIPTMKEQGFDAEYLMLRGVFGPGDMAPEAKKFYVGLLSKVSKSAAFKKYLKENALVDAWMTGEALSGWLGAQNRLHAEMLKGVVTEER